MTRTARHGICALFALSFSACSLGGEPAREVGAAPGWVKSWLPRGGAPRVYRPALAQPDRARPLPQADSLERTLSPAGLYLFALEAADPAPLFLVRSRGTRGAPVFDVLAEARTAVLDAEDERLWRAFTSAVELPEVQKPVFWQMDYWVRQYEPSENGWFVLVLGGRRWLPIALAFGPGARDLDPARFRYLGDSLVESMDMRFPAAQRARLRELLHQIDCVLDCSSALEATRPPGRGTEAGVPPAPGLARVLGAVEQALQRGYVNVECCEDEGSGEAALLIPYTLNRELIGTIQSRARRGENSPDGG
jgi:hypothetical protein